MVFVKGKSVVEMLNSRVQEVTCIGKVSFLCFGTLLLSNETELEVGLWVLIVQFMSSPEVKLSLSDISFIVLSTRQVEVALGRVRIEFQCQLIRSDGLVELAQHVVGIT